MKSIKKYQFKMSSKSRPFFVGMGSVMNISGNYFECQYPTQNDAKAIESDWEAIGRDFERATHDFKTVTDRKKT